MKIQVISDALFSASILPNMNENILRISALVSKMALISTIMCISLFDPFWRIG
jgi:hypothetical protein